MKNGELYKALFTNMINGFAHCRIVYEENRPVDWEFLVVNPAFEKQTGLTDVVGRLASKVIPELHQRNPRLLEIYSRVAQSRRAEEFEEFVEPLEAWFRVSVYSVEDETFTAVFENITLRKKMENLLAYKNRQLNDSYDDLIESWASALDLRDIDTLGHSQRLAKVTLRMMDLMSFYPPYMEKIKYGALLHDIGKILVPDHVLKKPAPLTLEEWGLMKLHAEYAFLILRNVEYLREVVAIPYAHHERWNGSGYPRGLAGTDIPLEVRIFSVADVFDALTTKRPYREAMSAAQAVAHLESEAGTLFDPLVVEVFVRNLTVLMPVSPDG